MADFFPTFPQLRINLSQRPDGNMKLEPNLINDRAITNRQQWLTKQKVDPSQVVSAGLISGNRVVVVTRADAGRIVDQADGLITDQADLYLAITVADCLPIVLFDLQHQVIALLHAGWRGLDQGIIRAAVKQLQTTFGTKSADLTAWIGPGIGPCHYEVQDDLVAKFADYDGVVDYRAGKNYLDLKEVARQQLVSLGIESSRIEVSSICTYDHADTYFSWRYDQQKPVQAMLMLVGRKTDEFSRFPETPEG